MFHRCCVVNCGNRRKDVILYRFPKSEVGLQKWLRYINCDRLRNLSVSELRKRFVCQKHFEKKFIATTLLRPRLIVGAYPTLFSRSENSSDISPTKQLERAATGQSIPTVSEAEQQRVAEHSYCKKQRHKDHSYCKLEPLQKHSRIKTEIDDTVGSEIPSTSPCEYESSWSPIEKDVSIKFEPRPSTSAPSSPPPPDSHSEVPPPSHNNTGTHSPTHDTEPTPQPCHAAGMPTSDAPADAGATLELDKDLLEILGHDPSQAVQYGKDIQPDLSFRLQHVAISGLTKETRKELLDKYLVPQNCTLIGAPALNPEVKAAISEAVLRKDKAIEEKQKQLASATSCIAEALTILLSAEAKNTTLIKLLMDACKILCDSQNSESNTRRNLVQLNIKKKKLKKQLLCTKIDKFLFSNELAETLKTAKAISKSGADIKIPSAKQVTKMTTSKPSQKNLNWKGPPQTYRPWGNQRTKEPVLKTRHESSSKKSLRAAQSYNRNRR